MVEKVITSAPNVVDFAGYQQGRRTVGKALAARACRHCGAALMEGENEDDCSSAVNVEALRLRGTRRENSTRIDGSRR